MSQQIVLDTNCLLMALPKQSPYRNIWDDFLLGKIVLCVSNEILEEYLEILSQKVNNRIAVNVISTILNQSNIQRVTPYYKFNLIHQDKDDNKFVDCAIAANARYIVSNDSHFKVLASIPFPRLEVINIQVFSAILKNL